MKYIDILNKWGKYSKYDKDQKSFNLLSNNYRLHKVGNIIEMLLSEYDSSGLLAVIYAKIQFEKILKDTQINLWDILNDPDKIKEESEMLSIFNSLDLVYAEKEFIDKLNALYIKATNGKLIGDEQDNRAELLNSIEKVAESINKCNKEVFIKGGKIDKIKNISTKLFTFNTMTECLTSIEKADDGMYFCFISAYSSADCFFNFIIKSNGNIVSINDRVDEAYIGQHNNLRNARWVESKVDDIFPYDYIFEYSNHDYKGYATKYELNTDSTDLYNLGIAGFMPILIAMLLIIMKYEDKEIDLPIHYIDSLIPQNRDKLQNKMELIKVNETSLLLGHNKLNLTLDNAKILSGEYIDEFSPKDTSKTTYKERGSFSNNNQIMVDLWADGFKYNKNSLFTKCNLDCIGDNCDNYIPEFIGTEQRLRLQVYVDARKQLADYINNKIYNAWVEYGKTEAIKKWYLDAIFNNKKYILKKCMEYEDTVLNKEGTLLKPGWHKNDGSISIYITNNDDYPSGHLLTKDRILGCINTDGFNFKCSITGAKCNTWFTIQPHNWKQLEELTGQEVPKIVKGWFRDRRGYSGNPLLDASDAVDVVKTPFEYRNTIYNDDSDAYFDFMFSFGFSKRGWNHIRKVLKDIDKD